MTRHGRLLVLCGVLALSCCGKDPKPKDDPAGDGDGDDTEVRPTDQLTRSHDDARSGANLHETILDTKNVNGAQFGKLFELEVDDKIYTQLLYVTDLGVAGKRRNVLYAATVNNTVYAFDADVPGEPLWKRNFNGEGRPTRTTEVAANCPIYRDFARNIGIVGTPVIDRASLTMYFITRTIEGERTFQRLQAIDIVSGKDRHAPVVISAKRPGTGDGAVDGQIAFDPVIHNQRMSLGLSHGVVYAGWASFCDSGPYHGWVMGYDAKTLAQVSAVNLTPDSWAGGVWQGGAAPMFDEAGDVYLTTGNSDDRDKPGDRNYGQCVVKLKARTLEVLDHFEPSNFDELNAQDLDLGSTGPTRLPGTDQLIVGGKEGRAYLLDMKKLGERKEDDTQIPQRFQIVNVAVRPNGTHHIHNQVVVWEGPGGLHVYAAGENDYMRMVRYDRTAKRLDADHPILSEVLPPVGMPGGMLSLSADGKKKGTGIVWSTTPRAGNANTNVTPGILRAYDAENMKLLWESTSAADDAYEFAKWNNPTIANGKVYIASFADLVLVYGLRTPEPAEPVNLAAGATATGGAPCEPEQGAEHLVDGKIYAQDEDDTFEWCSRDAPNLGALIDLGESREVSKLVVYHAAMGGQSTDYNTRAFELSVGTTEGALASVAKVTDNSASRTVHTFTPRAVRYIRLDVSEPQQIGANGAARIYEVEAY